MLKTVIFYVGMSLQLLGIVVLAYVCYLFFGDSGMKELLRLTVIGVVEFYGGTFMMKYTGRKSE